jgi:preprotein translocase subunit SecF
MQQQLDNLFGALTQGTGPQVTPLAFLMLMAVSLVSSLFIAYLYVHFYSNRATGSQVHRAFPLLGISITAIFVTIQFSLPLSLGLLGALSIVRFRTPIKEPEEIGFIMLVIATAIAVATFKLAFVGIIFIVALAALFGQSLTRRFTGAEADGTIVISMPANGRPADPAAITAVLRKRLPKARLESVSQTDSETVVSYNFQGIQDGALAGLQSELNAAAGPSSTYNVFFNRPGAL